MLNENDLITLRNLLFSERVTWRGNELKVVMELTAKINGQIEALKDSQSADSPGLTE